jgi:hypothetical protein
MRILPLALSLSTLASAVAQPPHDRSNWQNVQVLAAGTSIHVYTQSVHMFCSLTSVDGDNLNCNNGRDLIFQRSEIKSIKLNQHDRSVPLGIAIGAGLGAGVGAAACHKTGYSGLCATIGIPVGAIGGIIGYISDFTASTVYKAP